MHHKKIAQLIILAVLFSAPGLLVSCAHHAVTDARATGLDNRQDRMDSRNDARAERWRVRGEREDARARARFDAM